MAKKQRGKPSPAAKTTDSAKQTDSFSLVLASSDDEAPEEVTFEDSKAEALRSVRQALDAAKREKELLKEKRRKRQELFQEQKKRKLLPADVLEEIGSALSKKQKQSEGEAAEEEEPEEEGEEDEGRKKKKRKRSGKLTHARNLKGNYTVTTGKESTLASSQQQAAEDFLQSRLYGPGSCRTTNLHVQKEPMGSELRATDRKSKYREADSNEMLSLENKKGKNKSAAVQFVKKDWACQEKAKAEKLKKRWIHKQQIPSC